jgi:S-(hydroxymethyl)glutathione synthase
MKTKAAIAYAAVKPGKADFAGGTITCKCGSSPVTVTLKGNTAFNHVCGRTKCWKPEGALFAMVAVIGRDKLAVTGNGNKLKAVDEKAPIQRYACSGCGAHMYGRIENKDRMGEVRSRLKELKLESYACLSPGLMDLIATHAAKKKGTHAA